MANVEAFREKIKATILDPELTHHEFKKGQHGQKLDFDNIPDGAHLYHQWIDVNVDYIRANFPQLPGIILGVANGANRVAIDVARQLDRPLMGLPSAKDEQAEDVIRLDNYVKNAIGRYRPPLALVIEDVSTTGSSSVQVAQAALEAGAKTVEVLTTWQRCPELSYLEDAGIPYRAIIHEDLPTYSPEDCRTLPQGFCARGWQFIPRAK